MKFLVLFFFFTSIVFGQKAYQKTYFENGKIKAEGWIENTRKIAYWKFYYENGNLKKEGRFIEDKQTKYWYYYRIDGTKEMEGHFIKSTKNKWWLFYDTMEKVRHKCQMKNNQKNGYCFLYKNKKIVSAKKYKEGKQIKEWTDYNSFKKTTT
jgi:antitoxin component YwqK of YwqJK toxin-antitoxin module